VSVIPNLLCDSIRDRHAIVPDIHAPQSSQAIQQTAVILIDEKASITRLDQMGAGSVHVNMVSERMEVILLIE
jgi:hypothetical protein